MAISVNFGSSDAYTITLSWAQTSQSITDNTTAVRFTCTLTANRSATFSGYGRTDSLTVGGKTYSPTHGDYTVPAYGSVVLWTLDVDIDHDSDGTFSNKSISCGVFIDTTFSSSGYIGTVTATGKITLSTIARASSMSISGSTLGSAVTFAVQAASSKFWHTLEYSYGGASGEIFSGRAAGTYTWTPPIALAEEFPNAKSGSVIYTLTTMVGATTIGTKTYEERLSIPPSAAPTVSLGWVTISPHNAGTPAEFITNAFVQGYSKVAATFSGASVSTRYGATIASYKISTGGITASNNGADGTLYSGTIPGTSASVVCTITDSRGYSASEELEIILLPYSKPALTNITLHRSDSAGAYNSAGTHIYARATLTFSSLNGLNACNVLGYYRTQAGSYGAGIAISDIAGGETFASAALPTQTYVARIVATDSLGNSVSYEATIPTDSVSFHIKEPGNGAAFGKYSETDNLLEVAWDMQIGGGLSLGAALGIDSGGTGASTLGEMIKTVFTNGAEASITEYPTSGGIYATLGTDIFANMPHYHNPYGVLVIFSAYIYKLHIYLDAEKNLFYGWGGSGTVEPSAWYRVDGIEEEGTSGIWTYKKYEDGTAECWGTQDYSGAASTAWGSMYRLQCDPPDYPFEFTEIPVVSRDITRTSGSSCWTSGWSGGSTTTSGTFVLVRPSTGTFDVTVAFHAKGKWK